MTTPLEPRGTVRLFELPKPSPEGAALRAEYLRRRQALIEKYARRSRKEGTA